MPTLTAAPAAMTGLRCLHAGSGFQNDDISCWRQNSQKGKAPADARATGQSACPQRRAPAGERQHADAVDAHEPGAQERPSGGAGQVGAVQFGGTEPHAQNNQSDKAENPGEHPVETRPYWLRKEPAGRQSRPITTAITGGLVRRTRSTVRRVPPRLLVVCASGVVCDSRLHALGGGSPICCSHRL